MDSKVEEKVMENVEENAEEKVEEALKEQLHKAYLSGLSVGGKSFIGVIYEIILKDKKQRMNPAKTLMKIERSCKRMLDVADNYNKTTLKEDIAEAIDREIDKAEEKQIKEE